MAHPTKKAASAKRPLTGTRMLVKKDQGSDRKVTFGSVTVRAKRIDKAQIDANVASGQSALERIRDRLLTAGVTLGHRKDVPLYHVDPDRPDEVIRRLGTKVERGTLVNGAFRAKS